LSLLGILCPAVKVHVFVEDVLRKICAWGKKANYLEFLFAAVANLVFTALSKQHKTPCANWTYLPVYIDLALAVDKVKQLFTLRVRVGGAHSFSGSYPHNTTGKEFRIQPNAG